MTHKDKRQFGRTTKQMQALPVGGTYIVHTRMMKDYCGKLAKFISRPDIKIYTTEFLRHHRWCGLKFRGIDVDHFCPLTFTEARAASVIKEMIERNLPNDTSV